MSEKSGGFGYITSTEFRKQIKTVSNGAFVFIGEEEYMKKYCLKLAHSSVTEDNTLSLVNINIVDCSGDELPEEEISDALSVSSMLCEKHLVELQGISLPAGKKEKCSEIIDSLCSYADEIDDSTILIAVFMPNGIEVRDVAKNRPSEYLAKLSNNYTLVMFEPETKQRLVTWVSKHFIKEAVAAELSLCEMLVDICGSDMFTLENEITKLCDFLHKNSRNKLQKEDIQNISSKNAEYGDFDFSDAIMKRNSSRAFEILNQYKLSKESPELISASIITIFSNMLMVKNFEECGMMPAEIARATGMHEYRVKLFQKAMANISKKKLENICDLCMQTDEKIKNGNVDKYLLIDRMLGMIMIM